MARVAFEVHTKLSPEQVMSMLIDFSPRRPERWPTLARELYCVHKIATTSPDVREGSRWPTLMWERDHYDWSMAGCAGPSKRATTPNLAAMCRQSYKRQQSGVAGYTSSGTERGLA